MSTKQDPQQLVKTVEAKKAHAEEASDGEKVLYTRLCKRCGREFEPPEDSNGNARAFRCADCVSARSFASDLVHSCVLN